MSSLTLSILQILIYLIWAMMVGYAIFGMEDK